MGRPPWAISSLSLGKSTATSSRNNWSPKRLRAPGKMDVPVCNIIDQHRALHAHRIQILQQRLGRAAVLNDVIKSAAGLFHYLHRAGFEHVIRLDVNVAVGDEQASSS